MTTSKPYAFVMTSTLTVSIFSSLLSEMTHLLGVHAVVFYKSYCVTRLVCKAIYISSCLAHKHLDMKHLGLEVLGDISMCGILP